MLSRFLLHATTTIIASTFPLVGVVANNASQVTTAPITISTASTRAIPEQIAPATSFASAATSVPVGGFGTGLSAPTVTGSPLATTSPSVEAKKKAAAKKAAAKKAAAKKAAAKKAAAKKAAAKKAAAKKKAAKKAKASIKIKSPALSTAAMKRASIVKKAKSLAGTPYRTGGKSPKKGFDCSGFTSYVYKKAGINIPGQSSAQKAAGKRIPRSKAEPGDLIWTPGHVAIYLGGNKQIDAPKPGKRIHVRSIWQSNPTFLRF